MSLVSFLRMIYSEATGPLFLESPSAPTGLKRRVSALALRALRAPLWVLVPGAPSAGLACPSHSRPGWRLLPPEG